jgi:aspartyl aminopeptidase
MPHAEAFIEFVNSSKTHFHAVDTAKKMLVANGFKKLSEKEQWKLEPNGKYFYTRNQSTIVPFCVGGKFV